MGDVIATWLRYWESRRDVTIIDYPKRIIERSFLVGYEQVFRDYFAHLDEADVLFVVNVKKGDVSGYIGAAMFSEIAYVVSQVARGSEKRVILAEQPASNLFCSDELGLWMTLGWVTVFHGEIPRQE